MAFLVPVENGKVVDNSAEATSPSTNKSNAASKQKSGLDKEAFLQLLVAQMQYQDPLEPMDNTEYVAQLATFSQLEAIQNMTDRVSYSMANDLVGKYVIINTPNGTASGKVDYILYENGDIYLAVNDGLYSLDDLDTVADADYFEAFQMASMFANMMARLPDVNKVTAADAAAVEKARDVYDAMSPYQQSFVSKEDLEKLTALEEKIKELTGGSTEEKPDDSTEDDKVDKEEDKKLADG